MNIKDLLLQTPGNNYFYIKLDQNKIEMDQIHIFNVSGLQVDFDISADYNNHLLINNKLQPGFYLVSVNDSNGRITQKIIIE